MRISPAMNIRNAPNVALNLKSVRVANAPLPFDDTENWSNDKLIETINEGLREVQMRAFLNRKLVIYPINLAILFYPGLSLKLVKLNKN